ncbi:hypothetical protein ENUP19_0047G0062 [Entamoeba nuttalli]|uniref:Uncharacterized protein n=2 Tax=Entamoeba nuttalli TaxID=412467 RepID=K2G9U3_ENTNP|nr:hypothetical protein ENU1_138330 [Entamoeba nuttalli P19]EKE39186.1 hypothetical protein ENU1_138330 [Entamoeba nuttalli P19]|eukprot:XP_008858483.1 hypothetical protein ENU1_138330 [Entamoeba nuttalli P19]
MEGDGYLLVVGKLKDSIEKYIESKETISIDELDKNIEIEINKTLSSLKQLPLNQVNDLLLQNNVLIKTVNVMDYSDNSVQLFYVNHIQIHLRLLFALNFKEGCDPLPQTYLNSIVLLLNNVREILNEIGNITLNEYFTQSLVNKYSQIPASIHYITSQIDLNFQDGYYLIDQIINRSAQELGPIFSNTNKPKPVVIKKETLADLAHGKRRTRGVVSNPFHLITMEK